MKLVIDLARPELPLIILATLASLTSSVSELLSPILLGYALDLVVKQGTSAPIRDLLLLFAGIFALDFLTGACEFIKHGKNNDIGDFVRQRARGLLFSSVLHQDQAFLDQYHSSTFNLQYSMLDELHGLTGHLIPDLTGSTLSLLVTGFYLLNKNLLLGLLVLFIFSIQGLIQALSDKHRGVLYKKLLIFEQQCNAFREEAWNSAKTVKSFRAEDRLSRSFDSLLNRDRAIRCALVKSHATHESSSFLMSSLSSNLVWLIGLLSLIVTELGKRDEGGTGSKSSFISSAIGFRSLGELSAFLVIISKIRGAAIRFLRSISGLRKASSKLHQSLHLIHCEPNMKQGALTFPLISNTAAAKDDELNAPPSLRVDFKEVHFRYASRPTIEVLSGLNLTLEAGQVTALCGPSGGGKSTISALTLRLYDPSEGQVLFNGVDLRDLSNAALSGLVSIVSQEPVLFSDTIESNIKFGNSEATDQQFKEAALAANCHEFISGFTSGYQTQVGEKGVRLSGGQKQRIAIARALLCNPSLLILDEASSALDAESEHLVQEATERLMAGRTVLVVAHRLSTIRLADKIVVISEGRAVEEGRHEDLITHERGIYRQLIKRQLNGSLPPGLVEFLLEREQPPHLFVIRKQQRSLVPLSPPTLLGYYYILDKVIYEAPTIHEVLSARVQRCSSMLQQSFEKLSEDLEPLHNMIKKNEEEIKRKKVAARHGGDEVAMAMEVDADEGNQSSTAFKWVNRSNEKGGRGHRAYSEAEETRMNRAANMIDSVLAQLSLPRLPTEYIEKLPEHMRPPAINTAP